MRGMGGFRVQLSIASGDRAEITVLDGQLTVVVTLQARVLSPESLFSETDADEKTLVVLRYPGKATHPAGDLAPVSWFNEAGRGLLRVVSPGRRLVILPLLGLQLSPHAPVAASRGTRGPSRASELWLTVAAWCLPGGFTIPELIDTTGLASLTVRSWVKHMETVGLVAYDPVLSAIGNLRRFVLPADRRAALANLVIERWREWRSGTGHPSLRPDYRHFIAKGPWRTMQRAVKNLDSPCFASGITVLEGGPGVGAKSWLMPPTSADQAEVFLYATTSGIERLVASCDLTLLADADVADQAIPVSTICVLPDAHPAIRLYERRKNSDLYPSGWPWGLAALDALDHQDARVRQAAEDAWKDWLDNLDIERTKTRTRNG